MAQAKDQIAELQGRWQKLPLRTRLGITVAIAALVGVGTLVFSHASKPKMAVLFANLSQDDAARVVERLRAMNTPYELAGDGGAVLVPEEKVHETRLTLAAEGLPNGGGIGFEIFDKERFGESEFAEQVKYHRALEGELSRTIAHIAGVERARVHLVLPSRSFFLSNDTAASASVVLHTRPGWQMRDDQVRGVVHLVASSVRGLTPDRVTLVDGQGRSLYAGGEAGEEPSRAALEFRQGVERDRERSVQKMLDETLGPGTAVVRVAADVDLAKEQKTEEKFAPPPEAVTRSFQITEEREGGPGKTLQGVPGAASNLYGAQAEEGAASGAGIIRRSETRNFEISKVVTQRAEPVGRVKRLNVAVVVDGYWSGKGEERTFKPRSTQELERIKGLVASAAGIDIDRGDRVTIESLPFESSRNPRGPLKEDFFSKLDPYIPHLLTVLMGLAIFIVALTAVRRFGRFTSSKALAASNKGASDPLWADVGFRQPTLNAQALAPGGGKNVPQIAAELAAQDPDRAARILSGWIAEDT